MLVTIPQTSTSLYDILTESQRTALLKKFQYEPNLTIRLAPVGGDVSWTLLPTEDAVIGDSPSTGDGDIEYVQMRGFKSIKRFKLISALSGVSANIE